MTHSQLTPDQQEALLTLPTLNEDHMPYVRQMAQQADIPVERFRAALRDLAALGLATHGPVFNNDTGHPMGSTWWRTTKGDTLAAQLEGETA